MTPYDAFQDWLASILGEGYQYSRGMWVDHPSLDSAFIAAIQQTGGPPAQVDIRRLRFKVILLGPKGVRNTLSTSATQSRPWRRQRLVTASPVAPHLFGQSASR